MQLRLCETRWSRNRRLAGVKHLNRLEQVLARQEWRDPQIAEGVMLDEEARAISVTQGNLFLVKRDTLYTPELTHAGIAGVMRQLVIEAAERLGIPLQIGDISLEQLRCADALFVTNTLLGLCPVAGLEGRTYAVDRIPRTLRQAVTDLLQQAG
jgi:4-amino-4-deoxychorismate lyase